MVHFLCQIRFWLSYSSVVSNTFETCLSLDISTVGRFWYIYFTEFDQYFVAVLFNNSTADALWINSLSTVHCRIPSDIPGFQSLDATLVVTNQNVL